MLKAIGIRSIFKDEKLLVEGTIEEVHGSIPGYGSPDLPYLAYVLNNPAAINALEHEKYTIDDAPFYYVKMGSSGFIISHKDFRWL